MKNIFISVAIVCLAATAFAQNLASVSAGNIADLAGNKLAFGQLCFQATDQNDNPISFQVGGGGQVIRRAFCSNVTAGVVAGFSVPNPAATSPQGISYRVTVKDSSTGQEVLRYTGVTFAGAAFSFDTYVPLPAGSVFSPLTGTSVAGNLAVSGNLSVTGTFSPGTIAATNLNATNLGVTGAGVGSGGLGLISSTANAVANAGSSGLVWNGSWWNGSSAVAENWICLEAPANTIPNPQRSFFSCIHSPGIPLARVSFVDNNVATVTSNFASPDVDLIGHYWTGTASTTDEVFLSTAYGAGANPTVTAALNHFGSSGVFSLDLSQAKTVKTRRMVASGTALLAGNFSLSGWGTGASVSAIRGTDSAFGFTVTTGTAPVANPFITVTFADGAWTALPVCVVSPVAGSTAFPGTGGSLGIIGQSTTGFQIEPIFTPLAGNTYAFNVICVGV